MTTSVMMSDSAIRLGELWNCIGQAWKLKYKYMWSHARSLYLFRYIFKTCLRLTVYYYILSLCQIFLHIQDCSDESTPFLLVTTSDIILMGKQDVPILTLKRDEVSKAVVSLCAAYYAFQLEFPLQAANAYAFLDEFIINSANTSKNSSYRNQVSRYAKFLANSC